ncbi:MAG: hypothetical protein GEV06_24620 [Luteitalea sp.]|nr:hypothetical protein [Luteitalea sp.]
MTDDFRRIVGKIPHRGLGTRLRRRVREVNQIARAFAREGVSVFLNGLRETEAPRVVREIEASGGRASPPSAT